MARGEGRVFRRLNCKTWSVGLYVTDEQGKRREKIFSSGSEKRADAVALLREKRAERDLARFSGKRLIDGSKVLLTTLLDALKSDFETREIKSLRPTLYHMDRVREHFGGWKAMAVTPAALRDYVQKRRHGGRADATIARELEILQQAFTLGVREKFIGEAPEVPKLYPRKRNKRRVRLDPQEIADFLAWAEKEDVDAFHYHALLFLTGMRPSTIRSLETKHLDKAEWVLFIDEAIDKNDYGRGIALEGRDREIIEARLGRLDPRCSYLFQRKGQPLGEEWLRKFFYRGCKAIGIVAGRKNGGKTPYDLKKSSTRAWTKSGVSEHLRMVSTGHKTVSTFRDYDYQEVEDQRAAKRMRDAYLDQTMPEAKPIVEIAHISQTK